MAAPSGTLRVGRYFLALFAIFVVLYGLVYLPGHRHTPKLGIDLVGGIRVIFTAQGTTNGSQMDVARQIIQDRVNGNGVTGATVQVQGGNQILVLIPGGTGQDVKELGAAAKLNFRPLVAPAVPVTCGKYAPQAAASTSPSGSPTAKPTNSATTKKPSVKSAQRLTGTTAPTKPVTKSSGAANSSGAAKSGAAKSSGASASTAAPVSPSASPTQASKPGKCTSKPFVNVLAANKGLKVPTVDTAFDKLPQAQQTALLAGEAGSDGAQVGGLTNFDCKSAELEPDLNSSYYVACGSGINPQAPDQEYAFLLGKVIVPGTQISDANAQAPNPAAGQAEWTVALNLKSSGSRAWGKYTTAHNIGGSSTSAGASATSCGASAGAPCADFVAFTLNGEVISAPVNEEPINGGTTQISGSFSASSSKKLAQQLQFGSLPLTFRLDAQQPVSATLGKSQLHAALLAGGIGLLLVILYSLAYYRGLGLITVASLAVSGGLTYGMLVLLGEHMGFTLDLAGVTGFIVALGITADSFVVFFERIKDEVHEGRSARVAVPRAWVRARRTILSADTVSFLAAAILYFFASADVQGFAFTLGLSTILDLVVVFLFTHPIVSVLSRSRAFGSKRFTGLDSVHEGGISRVEAPDNGARRASGSSAAAGAGPARASTTAVLDKPAGKGADPAADVGDSADEPAPPSGDPASRSDEAVTAAERKHTTPAAGTAAERAAARRARLRDEQSGRDKDGDR